MNFVVVYAMEGDRDDVKATLIMLLSLILTYLMSVTNTKCSNDIDYQRSQRNDFHLDILEFYATMSRAFGFVTI